MWLAEPIWISWLGSWFGFETKPDKTKTPIYTVYHTVLTLVLASHMSYVSFWQDGSFRQPRTSVWFLGCIDFKASRINLSSLHFRSSMCCVHQIHDFLLAAGGTTFSEIERNMASNCITFFLPGPKVSKDILNQRLVVLKDSLSLSLSLSACELTALAETFQVGTRGTSLNRTSTICCRTAWTSCWHQFLKTSSYC